MNLLSGLLWALGGLATGTLVGAAAGALYAHLTQMTSREGASGYFVMGLAILGGLIGLLAGLVLYARQAPDGQGLLRLGQGALGVVLAVALLVAAVWGWMQTREVPLLYGNAQAQLLLEFRVRKADAPPLAQLIERPAHQWLSVEVTTSTTRPEALVLREQLREEGEHLVAPAVMGPLVRSGSRLVVARLKLGGQSVDEVFRPPMPRTPNPRADWSDWVSPAEVFDAQGEVSKTPSRLQLRWKLRLYGE